MHYKIVLLAALLAVAGCGRSPAPQPRTPLTVEEWRAIPDDEIKYSRRTMERLKAGTAKK